MFTENHFPWNDYGAYNNTFGRRCICNAYTFVAKSSLSRTKQMFFLSLFNPISHLPKWPTIRIKIPISVPNKCVNHFVLLHSLLFGWRFVKLILLFLCVERICDDLQKMCQLEHQFMLFRFILQIFNWTDFIGFTFACCMETTILIRVDFLCACC